MVINEVYLELKEDLLKKREEQTPGRALGGVEQNLAQGRKRLRSDASKAKDRAKGKAKGRAKGKAKDGSSSSRIRNRSSSTLTPSIALAEAGLLAAKEAAEAVAQQAAEEAERLRAQLQVTAEEKERLCRKVEDLEQAVLEEKRQRQDEEARRVAAEQALR